MERPSNIKDPKALVYIQYLETSHQELEYIKKNPILTSYLTIRNKIDSINKQLNSNDNEVDIFSDKDDKSFDRMKAYFDKILEWNKTLKELYSLMSIPEQKEADNHSTVAAGSLLEKHIFNKKS